MNKRIKMPVLALALCAAFLVRFGYPAWAGESKETDDFSSLLGETAEASEVEEPTNKDPWGINFEGELRTSLWGQYGGEKDWKTTNRLGLKAEKQVNDLKLLGRLKVDFQNLEEDEKVRVDPRELYAQYRLQSGWFDYLDVTVGKKILYWGKGDEFRPVDIANPEDLTANYYYLKNERKTGVLGLFADWALNQNIGLELFWSPYFQKSWTPETGDYFAPPGLEALDHAGVPVGSDEPDDFSGIASAGGRIKLSLARFDIGLYGYYGYNNLPTYTVTGLTGDPTYGLPIVPTEVSAKYHRLTMFGADFERAVGDYVFRGEIAWLADGNRERVDWSNRPTLLLDHPDGAAEAQKLSYVFGFDRNDLFIRHLYVNAQYVGQYILDYEDGFTSEQATHGMTLSLHYSILDSLLKFRYWFVGDFTDQTYRHLVEGTYKMSNWAELSLGLITFQGDEDTLFGQYENKDYIYAQLKLIF